MFFICLPTLTVVSVYIVVYVMYLPIPNHVRKSVIIIESSTQDHCYLLCELEWEEICGRFYHFLLSWYGTYTFLVHLLWTLLTSIPHKSLDVLVGGSVSDGP